MRLLASASSLLDLIKDEASYLDAPLVTGEANFCSRIRFESALLGLARLARFVPQPGKSSLKKREMYRVHV